MKRILLFAVIFLAALSFWIVPRLLHSDPYLEFSKIYLTGTDAGFGFHKLPLKNEFSISEEGIGPFTFRSPPSKIIEIVGKPDSISTYASVDGEVPFFLSVNHSQFAFTSKGLYRAYLQISDFPNLNISGHPVNQLTRDSVKALGFKMISEGRQDLKFKYSDKLNFSIGFISDGGHPSGKPFFLSFEENAG